MPIAVNDAGEAWCVPDADGQRRSQRWARRARAKIVAKVHKLSLGDQHSVLQRLSICGVAKDLDVEIKFDGKKCFASGLMSCGNIWTCATCSARIRVRREAELAKVAAQHCELGGRLAMMTLTVRHDRSMSLKDSLGAVLRSWDLIQRRVAFSGSPTSAGVMSSCSGFVRALEVTYGPNGWHPHLHVLLFVNPGVTAEQALSSRNELFAAWSELVTKELGVSPTIERGINFVWFGDDSATAAHYVSKISKEITFADSKSGLDPMSLLDDTSPASTAMFIEFAEAMYRKRAMSWSRDLRRSMNLEAELTDEELADENDACGVHVAFVSAAYWKAMSWRERLGWIEFFEAQRLFDTG